MFWRAVRRLTGISLCVPCTSLALLALACLPAQAAERKLSGSEITAALADHTYRDPDPAKQIEQLFHAGGATYYNTDGQQSQGRWRVTGDQYCSNWPPGESWPCYDVFADGELIVFVSGSGTRYPMVKVN